MIMITINFKKISFVISIFLILLITSCSSLKLKNDFNYVYILESSSEGKQNHIGTCFYADNKFYTNAHLVLYKELNEYVTADTIIAKDEINNINYKLNLDSYDISNDIAFLSMDLKLVGGLSIIRNYQATIGESIFTIGNLNNYGLAYAYGKITSGLKTFTNLGSNITYVQTNIEISGGNSGDPVFNEKNNVIGIMSLKLTDNGQYVDGVSFFVKIY